MMEHGQGDGSLCERIDFNLIRSTLLQAFPTIRGDTVTVVGIVVVQIASSIDVTDVVAVASVRRTTNRIYNRQPLYLCSSDLFQVRRRFCTSSTSPIQ